MTRVVLAISFAIVACGRVGFETSHDDAGTDGAFDGQGEPAVWRPTTPLPSARTFGCAIAWGGLVYYLGGSTGTAYLAEVVSAPILADGTLGAWTQQTPLPIVTHWQACAVDPVTRTVFMVGGNGGAVALTQVYRATIAADGTIGAWVSEIALPGPRRGLGATVENGVLYALGGEAGDGFQLQATVYAAQIGAGGALGAWTTAAPMPAADYVFGTASASGRIYLTGGYTTHAGVRAAPSGQGFSSMTAMPGPRERHASVATGGYVYVMGGQPTYQTGTLGDALRAPIGADGTLGTWSALSDLPGPISYPSTATWSGRIYALGGLDNTATFVDSVSVLTPPP